MKKMLEEQERYFRTQLVIYRQLKKAMEMLKEHATTLDLDVRNIDVQIASCEDWIKHYEEFQEVTKL